jgi:DNA-binding protein H-NS
MPESGFIVSDDTHPALTPRAATRRERAAAIDRICTLMDFWGITAEDLISTDSEVTAYCAAPHASVKYRHPVSGATWNGRGEHPEWLRSALLKEGYRLDELRPEAALATERAATQGASVDKLA